MTTNGVSKGEDADMAECDGEKVVTMMDVLQEEQDFEDDANAVLGASDEKNCTYAKGYIKRQAIYACLTCCAEAKDDSTKRAGVCLACSLNCHENHELVELYTKRNFRCDCGNPKFNSHLCHFTPNKSELNEENTYNQNFSGLYCTCHRPYPDPESNVEDDEMIQCIICEDWLHASHLDATVPGNDQYSEMICKACMEKNDFLHDYSHLVVNVENQNIDVVGIISTDLKVINSNINTKNVVNGTDDSSVDTIEKLSDNMDIDKAQTEDTSLIENDNIMEKRSQILVEENKEIESDVAMDAENIEIKLAQNSSNVTVESELKTEVTQKYSGDTQSTEITENKLEESAIVNTNMAISDGDTLEESTQISEDKLVETDGGDTLEESMPISEDKLVETNSGDTLEETTPISENKLVETANLTTEDTTKVCSEEGTSKLTSETVETTSEQQEPKFSLENGNEIDKQELQDSKIVDNADLESEKGVCAEVSENMNKIIELSSENVEEASKMDSSDVLSKQGETLVTADVDEDTANDRDSNKESSKTESNDMTQDDKTSSMEIEKVSSDINSEDKITTEETETTSNLNTNQSEINIDETSEHVSNLNTGETEVTIAETSENVIQAEENKDMKRKLSAEEAIVTDDHVVKKLKLNGNTCIRPKGVKRVHKGATFWPSNFRQKLCTCSECLSMYKDLSVLFLIDLEDTVFAYETLGKERVNGRATQYEKGLEALSSLDRIQQINALTEYNKMKDKLLDFLQSFKDRKEVVKEEDIKAFFAGMKPKREPDGVYFCR